MCSKTLQNQPPLGTLITFSHRYKKKHTKYYIFNISCYFSCQEHKIQCSYFNNNPYNDQNSYFCFLKNWALSPGQTLTQHWKKQIYLFVKYCLCFYLSFSLLWCVNCMVYWFIESNYRNNLIKPLLTLVLRHEEQSSVVMYLGIYLHFNYLSLYC